MEDTNEAKPQVVNAEQAAPATREERVRAARRSFLRQALAVTSGIALAEMLPFSLPGTEAQTATCPTTADFVAVGELTSKDRKLQGVIKLVNGERILPGQSGRVMMRYFAGYTPNNLRTPVWPTTANVGPGPTLRCQVGDSVQLAFFNQVDVSEFAGTAFSGQKGTPSGCDEVNAGRWYPANDLYPNCFHASSAANMHFHGTHVTPSTTGDNVLINIQPPMKKMTDADVSRILAMFKSIFDKGEAVPTYDDLPLAWRELQMGKSKTQPGGLIGEYDANAIYNGQRGGLPADQKLWPHNQATIDKKQWPQYYVGSYPICFRIPSENTTLKMGQAPGTHWYHAHKHGSTSINLFNGMAGALIIENHNPITGYDGGLNAYYGSGRDGKPRLQQVVMVLQQLTDTINLMVNDSSSNVKSPPVYVNGQAAPTIKMKPGEVQLWRMINATVSNGITAKFVLCSGSAPLDCRQTAQDGVQFSPTNYENQVLGNTGQNPLNFPMAPANRVDLLVKAPTSQGLHMVQMMNTSNASGPFPLLYVRVTNDPPVNPPMNFPPKDRFPKMPEFLKDITAGEVNSKPRTITYNTIASSVPTGRQLTQWAIDGKQFQNGVVNQPIQIGAVEEWTIINATTQAAHPFHIHVNPFQIIEVFDPNSGSNPQPIKIDKDFVWWDTFAIPKKNRDTGVNGYFKMRSRFVDFTGMFVQHCHILVHEDRGMMQLVNVCKDVNKDCSTTTMQHH